MEKIFKSRLWYISIEQFLMKYSWSCAGQVILALPILLSLTGEGDGAEAVGQRTRMYTTAKNYLINGGDAAERLMTSYKEVIIMYC